MYKVAQVPQVFKDRGRDSVVRVQHNSGRRLRRLYQSRILVSKQPDFRRPARIGTVANVPFQLFFQYLSYNEGALSQKMIFIFDINLNHSMFGHVFQNVRFHQNVQQLILIQTSGFRFS